jgi:hypothetical protein
LNRRAYQVFPAARWDHIGACFGESFAQRQPDSAGSSDDYGSFIRQVEKRVSHLSLRISPQENLSGALIIYN